MAKLSIVIKQNNDPELVHDWSLWMRNCDQQFLRIWNDYKYNPFKYHEQEAVGLLSVGAALAGYPTLCECGAQNLDRSWGRFDLWFAASGTNYYFEFKRCNFEPSEGRWNFKNSLDDAEKQARKRNKNPRDRVFSAVIACTDRINKKKRTDYDGYVDDVDIVFILGASHPNQATRIYFKEVLS